MFLFLLLFILIGQTCAGMEKEKSIRNSPKSPKVTPFGNSLIVNLMDSPGEVDCSSEIGLPPIKRFNRSLAGSARSTSLSLDEDLLLNNVPKDIDDILKKSSNGKKTTFELTQDSFAFSLDKVKKDLSDLKQTQDKNKAALFNITTTQRNDINANKESLERQKIELIKLETMVRTQEDIINRLSDSLHNLSRQVNWYQKIGRYAAIGLLSTVVTGSSIYLCTYCDCIPYNIG